MNKQRSIPLDCMELDFDGVHVRLTVQQFDVLYPYKKKCETTEKERNEMSEKWIAQSIKIEELELFFKVEKETLNKVTKDYIELEKAYEDTNLLLDVALREKKEIEVELGQLKRDVQRAFELANSKTINKEQLIEYEYLKGKLSKVGNE